MWKKIKERLRLYWELTKALQTGLLLLTGITGFITSKCPIMNYAIFISLIGSLFLSISGSTVLNMVIDRDIDTRMGRTAKRPLPAGKIKPKEAIIVGLSLSLAGILWAFSLSILYGLLIFSGLFFDVVVYSMWLKRRTPWSIVWGGIAGAMPIIAGRALGVGKVDFIGILLGLSILLWIPTHILTFSMKYYTDYAKAGIPTFPSVYGFQKTRLIIAVSSVGSALSVGIGITALGLSWGYLRLLAVFSTGLLGLVFLSIIKPSERVNMGLFKYASLFMLSSMLILISGTLL
ncbi:MAG: UbiA family prenyltransferase [Candidatus Aminicenantes bacterium]|nr:UbiA family prenyltransferase [Candidatus Aminicenantes bacterium]